MKKIISCLFLLITLMSTNIVVMASNWSGATSLNRYTQVDVDFRAAWVCTVSNMDVAKQKDTSEESINLWKQQYLDILDNMQKANLNVVIFQIRPCNDAFYPSKYNPWSEFLCGYGKDPGWDPLEWMIEVTHERGMEYHAWMNPYRATTSANYTYVQGGSIIDYNDDELQAAKHNKFSSMKSIAEANGSSNIDNPAFLEGEELEYNVVLGSEEKYVLNPASEKTLEHLENTIREVVENYDIDGIHFDDYFYPDDKNYTSIGTNANLKGKTFSTEPLVDYQDYQDYVASGGSETIYNWRRGNVNTLIESLSNIIREVNTTKDRPCAFGISPSARWAPAVEACPAGSPRPAEGGMQGSCNNYYSYSDLYADTKKWVDEEWLDYIIPQAYAQLNESYREIVDWWSDAMQGSPVKLYIGTPIYRVDEWGFTDEIYYQVRYNSSTGNRVDGYSLFRYKSILSGKGKTAMSMVTQGLWRTNALTPLYEGYNYKHTVSDLAKVNEIIEVSETTLRLKYNEIEDAKAYILYRIKDETVDEIDISNRVAMNLKAKGSFEIEYDSSYQYHLATVSYDNTIYIDEEPISFENIIINEKPIITQESQIPQYIFVESVIDMTFKVVDPEKMDMTINVYILEGNSESELSFNQSGDLIYVSWDTPFVSMDNLRFKVVAYDGVKTTTFETETFNVIEECPHNFGEATCESPAKCSICGATKGTALGHKYSDVTCTEDSVCSVCGKLNQEALGHDYSDPTCTTGSTCSRCDDILDDALGHNWTNATCENPATCSVCGETEGDALGHNWIKATCTNPATCSVCGETEGDALGHTEEVDPKVNPTCEKTGLTEGSHCAVCGEVIIEQEEIEALGHEWVDATKKDPKTCSVCGKTEGEKLKGCKKASVATMFLSINMLITGLILLRRRGK